MTLPNALKHALSVPAIGAPMFLVSFPPLVSALCRAGVIGAFPHVNARPSEQLDRWLSEIEADLRAYKDAHPGAKVAPHAVNLIVHRTNARYEPDLDIVVAHKVPLVITCLGDPRRTIEAVHGYGGLVFCDVVNALHARKAIEGGADGLICVGGGAGGHASNQSAFSLVREVREFWTAAWCWAAASATAIRFAPLKYSAPISPIWARAFWPHASRTRRMPTNR